MVIEDVKPVVETTRSSTWAAHRRELLAQARRRARLGCRLKCWGLLERECLALEASLSASLGFWGGSLAER